MSQDKFEEELMDAFCKAWLDLSKSNCASDSEITVTSCDDNKIYSELDPDGPSIRILRLFPATRYEDDLRGCSSGLSRL